MGEKIKNIGKFTINDNEYVIELNKSSGNSKEFEIHIQSNNTRFELSESEYNQFSSTINLAIENLKKIKKIK
jgi:hypothetical protein